MQHIALLRLREVLLFHNYIENDILSTLKYTANIVGFELFEKHITIIMIGRIFLARQDEKIKHFSKNCRLILEYLSSRAIW